MTPLGPLRDLYVPTDSAECALATISMALRAGCSPVLLTGPSGIGKTLLLRVMAEREREAFPRVRILAELPPAPGESAARLLQVLFAVVPPRRSRAAELELLHQLHADAAGRSLLLVDDLHRASEASIRKLAELARAAKPALAIVAAGSSLEDHHELTEALAAGFSVLLPESLPLGEMQVIYDALRVHPELSPSLREQLEKQELEEILGGTAGRPEQLKRELARLKLAEAAAAPPILAPSPPPRRRSVRFALRAVESALGAFGDAAVRGLLALADIFSERGPAAIRSLRWALPAALVLAAVIVAVRNPPPTRLQRTAEPAIATITESPAPAPAPARPTPAPAPVEVHVNARPWARIWIDGKALGPTPLKRALPSGTHELEAEFPNGKRIRREIEVAPDRRRFSLP